MFKFKFFCLTLLLLISNTLPEEKNNDVEVNNGKEKGGIPSLVKKYTVSLVAGTCLGAFEGAGCFVLDSIMPITLPVNWILSRYARKDLVANCQESMKEKEIDYDSMVMENSSWMASWIGYIMLEVLTKHKPLNDLEKFIK